MIAISASGKRLRTARSAGSAMMASPTQFVARIRIFTPPLLHLLPAFDQGQFGNQLLESPPDRLRRRRAALHRTQAHPDSAQPFRSSETPSHPRTPPPPR